MKIGIVSDTHLMNKYIDEAIEYLKDCNLILHAGDNFKDSKYIHEKTQIGMLAVKGNCDFDNVEEELLFDVEGKNIFLCHGDQFDVKHGLDKLKKQAIKVNADIVIFGHTHTPLCKYIEGILYINPGSTSLPRGVSYRSLCILNIENDEIDVKEVIL